MLRFGRSRTRASESPRGISPRRFRGRPRWPEMPRDGIDDFISGHLGRPRNHLGASPRDDSEVARDGPRWPEMKSTSPEAPETGPHPKITSGDLKVIPISSRAISGDLGIISGHLPATIEISRTQHHHSASGYSRCVSGDYRDWQPNLSQPIPIEY